MTSRSARHAVCRARSRCSAGRWAHDSGMAMRLMETSRDPRRQSIEHAYARERCGRAPIALGELVLHRVLRTPPHGRCVSCSTQVREAIVCGRRHLGVRGADRSTVRGLRKGAANGFMRGPLLRESGGRGQFFASSNSIELLPLISTGHSRSLPCSPVILLLIYDGRCARVSPEGLCIASSVRCGVAAGARYSAFDVPVRFLSNTIHNRHASAIAHACPSLQHSPSS